MIHRYAVVLNHKELPHKNGTIGEFATRDFAEKYANSYNRGSDPKVCEFRVVDQENDKTNGIFEFTLGHAKTLLSFVESHIKEMRKGSTYEDEQKNKMLYIALTKQIAGQFGNTF